MNWNRSKRFVLGRSGLAQGIAAQNNVLMVIGGLLLVQGLFNVGCCGTSCAPAARPSSTPASVEEVQYEEVK